MATDRTGDRRPAEVRRALAGIVRAYDRLVGLIFHEETSVRIAAAAELHGLGASGLAHLLRTVATTRDDALRVQAMKALGAVGPDCCGAVVPALYIALRDHEDEAHRGAFFAALSCLPAFVPDGQPTGSQGDDGVSGVA